MDDIKRRVETALAELKQEADELRVQVHLAKMEASDEWRELEAKLAKLEANTKELASDVAESTKKNLGAAATALAKDIRDGLKKFAKGL